MFASQFFVKKKSIFLQKYFSLKRANMSKAKTKRFIFFWIIKKNNKFRENKSYLAPILYFSSQNKSFIIILVVSVEKFTFERPIFCYVYY